jgi:acetate kinase
VNILVINSGSSSIKYRLLDMDDGRTLAAGELESIGTASARLCHRVFDTAGRERSVQQERAVADHRLGLHWIGEIMQRTAARTGEPALDAIGHRVVHGGEQFQAPALVTDAVLEGIRRALPLAPLHNPANLLGIEVAREFAPGVPQVAVFDTAFHQSMPAHAYLYALPYELYENHAVRRYGFHGTSHGFVARAAAGLLRRPLDELNLISIHLGNGASATAIRRGRSVDTSMGLTPLEGLVMGSRCGDIDPALVFYLARQTGQSYGDIEELLNTGSGLKGLCGHNDMRAVLRLAGEGDERARLAVDLFCYRIRKYIGAYFAVLGRLDALVFTGGIGENQPGIRAQCCTGLDALGIRIDAQRNTAPHTAGREVQASGAGIRVLVIPTNEELEIARQTLETLEGPGGRNKTTD